MFENKGDPLKGQLMHNVVHRKGCDQSEIIDLLLHWGVPVDESYQEGLSIRHRTRLLPDMLGTPLHWAIDYDQVHTVQHLLLRGADPSKTNGWGRSAFQLAEQRGIPEVIAVLQRFSTHRSTATT